MLSIVMLMLAQEVTGPPGDEPVRVAIPRLTAPPARDCRGASEDEIVVCGQQEDFRVRPLADPRQPRDASVGISPNKSAGVRLESSGNPFLPAPRIMVDFKILF